MNKLMTTGTLGLAGLVTTGLIAWQAPLALADEGRDDRGRDDRFTAVKRDDDAAAVITTVDDDDDDDTGLGDDTGTHTRTRGGVTDHSRSQSVRDLTSDGPGSGNVDDSRGHTNDGTRHNTRG